MESIIRYLSAVYEDELSFLFVSAIFGLLIIALTLGLVTRFASKKISARFTHFVEYAPGAMTTIGVIGTFFGIFVGLLDFDVSDIDNSVPSLLVGLKVAFATSIAGMVCSLSFRLLQHSGRMAFGSRPLELEDDDPIQALAEIKRSIDLQTRALIGNQDPSILSNLKLARQEARDGFEAQRKAFEQFAEQMQEGATKILIESLKGVIEDFNQKITEQFGDNFKQLNSAVGNLNSWQQEYKVSIIDTQEQLKAQSDNIKSISDNLQTVASNISSLSSQAQAMPIAAEKMAEANQAVLDNFSSMNELLKSMSELRSQAETVVPEIENSLKQMSATLQNTADELGTQIKAALERTHQGTTENFKAFDEQMTKELGNVLTEMGTNLTSLSNKFVSDYTPLTDKLRQLVREVGQVRQ